MPFDEIDMRDLVALVQRLRLIGWRAALGPARLHGVLPPWFEDLDSFVPFMEALSELASDSEGKRREECLLLAAETARVHEALLAGPAKPSPDDVIARYVSCEIGDRTAQYVLGWDARRLADECIKRGLPTVQVIVEDGGRDLPGMPDR